MRTAMIADELRRRGHSVVWWSTTFFHPTKQLLFPDSTEVMISDGYGIRLIKGLPYQTNISLRRYLHYKLLAHRFQRICAREDPPDLIVAALPDYDLTAQMVRYARSHGIPVLVDIQDLWPDIFLVKLPRLLRPFGRAALAFDFLKLRTLLWNATGLLACSEAYLNWGIRGAGRERRSTDQVFYHGYPEPEMEPKRAIPNECNALIERLRSKQVFTFVGTFGHSYDLPLVVAAARRIAETDPDVHFVLAGAGEQSQEIGRMAADLENVTLPGWLQKSSISAILQVSEVGLATYTAQAPQSLSYKPFEYLAHGLPILSSLQGELKDLLATHDVGETYQAGDVNDFVMKVLNLARNPGRMARLSNNARTVFSNHFSKEKIYGAYVSHIESILAQKYNECREIKI